MTERPIIFSTPMVKAILNGTKTQTRRIVKPQPIDRGQDTISISYANGKMNHMGPTDFMLEKLAQYGCPYGRKNDGLWVRENYKPGAWRDDGRVALDYQASPDLTNTPWVHPVNFDELWQKWTDELIKKGSIPDEFGIHHWEPGKSPLKWRPSIHMPRWASRIDLLIKNIRVERLNEISERDAIAEGIELDPLEGNYNCAGKFVMHEKQKFRQLWESINGPDSWSVNPFVWVIDFERIKP